MAKRLVEVKSGSRSIKVNGGLRSATTGNYVTSPKPSRGKVVVVAPKDSQSSK